MTSNCATTQGEIRKMPYEELRKLFEQRSETRPRFWQRITPGNAVKWSLAGVLCAAAVLLMR
jgi:hypothetical protein